jgi:hypothetical protein
MPAQIKQCCQMGGIRRGDMNTWGFEREKSDTAMKPE